MNIWTLTNDQHDKVLGARIEMTREEMMGFLDWLNTESRIKERQDLSVPCLMRSNFEAINETYERLQLEGGQL